MVIAFSDINDGYYQYAWDGISPLPEWTKGLVSCAVISRSLADMKIEMWRKIHDERERRSATGGFYVAPYWFHSDDRSRGLYLGAIATIQKNSLADNYILNPAWKTMGGVKTPMTAGMMWQILSASFANEAALHANAESHKAAMEASQDPLSYDYSTGWPVMFA